MLLVPPEPRQSRIHQHDRRVIPNHEAWPRPRRAVVKRRGERPEIGRWEEVDAVRRDVAKDVKRPGAHDPGKGFSKEPDETCHSCEDDETVGDVVASVHVIGKVHETCAAYPADEEWSEGDNVR